MPLQTLVQEGRELGPCFSAVTWIQCHHSPGALLWERGLYLYVWCPETEMFLSGDRKGLGQLVRAGFLCLYKRLCCHVPCGHSGGFRGLLSSGCTWVRWFWAEQCVWGLLVLLPSNENQLREKGLRQSVDMLRRYFLNLDSVNFEHRIPLCGAESAIPQFLCPCGQQQLRTHHSHHSQGAGGTWAHSALPSSSAPEHPVLEELPLQKDPGPPSLWPPCLGHCAQNIVFWYEI